jgi:acyl-CoA oxidase
MSAHDSLVSTLRDMVFAGQYEKVDASVRAAVIGLHAPVDSDRTQTQRARRAYDQLREVMTSIGTARDLAADPPRLFALFDWAAIAAPDLFPVLSGHFNLTVGAIQRLGSQSAWQREHLERLDDAGHAGVFLLTELGYGSNVLEMETEAVWDQDRNCFVLTTPSGPACKFMPNVAAEGVPKTTVVAARLKVGGNDEGVFPFIVALRSDEGTARGVDVFPMPDKGVAAMDNAMIRFDHVVLPYDAWLTGGIARIDEGSLVCPIPVQERFHRTIAQLQTGRIALSAGAVASARAALYLTARYAERRRTAGGVPMAKRDNVQRSLASCAARIYAATALANEVRRQFADPAADQGANALLAMLTKPLLSSEALTVLQECRERCGAQGMFRVNRITDYLGNLQGVITAEGENQVLKIAAGRILRRIRTRGGPGLAFADSPRDLPWWHLMLADRVQALATAAVTTDETATAAPCVGPSSHAMDLADAAADRLAMDALSAAAENADAPAQEILRTLATIYALEKIQEHATWYTATGHLTPDRATEVERRLVRGYRTAAESLPALVDAFEIPDLGAPIADDYIANWLRLAGWTHMRAHTPA